MTKQSVSDSRNVVQVAGDATVNNYGLALQEVRELAMLFLKENFPQLRAEAMTAAENNTSKFLKDFEVRLLAKIEDTDAAKFKDPDVQASLNDAIMAAARKGDKSNQEILIDLVLERVSTKTDDLVSLVAAEAIKVAPRLTKEQILFLSLVLAHHNFKLIGATSLKQIDTKLQPIVNMIKPVIAGFSDSNKAHLAYASCMSINQITSNTPYAIWNHNNDFLKDIPEEALKMEIQTSYPALDALAKSYIDNKLGQITLTSVGIIIALANIQKAIGKLQYSNWLN